MNVQTESQRRRQATISLGIHQEHAAVGDHVAYFWETEQEFVEGVKFLATGLNDGDYVVLFGYEDANEKVCRILEEHYGFDCEALQRKKLLSVVTGNESGERMLATIGDTFTEATRSGARLIRLLGNIGWGRKGWPAENDILAFEARVTGAAREYPCIVVCMYDVRTLPGRAVLHGAFETHPLTMCGNLLRENPHHIPAEQFLSNLKANE